MRITTNTVSSRLPCSTAKAASSRLFAKRPGGKEIRTFLRRLLRAIRTNWPNTQILLRADSHYCCPEVLDWWRANGRRADHDVAPAHRGPRGQHEGALRGRAEGRQDGPLQGVL